MNTPNKLHPLLAVAAVSLTVASLVAIGVMTGVLPGTGAPNAPKTADAVPVVTLAPAVAPTLGAPTAETPPPVSTEQKTEPTKTPPPAIKHAKTATRPLPHKVAAAMPPPPPVPGGQAGASSLPPVPPDYHPAATPPAPATCRDCGTVESVREVVVQPTQGPGVGAVAGGVLGGVLGHQMGSGRGNDAATVLGAIGGAVAGHQIEKSKRRTVHYETTVRMDDGTIQTITAEYSPAWRGGERVKVTNGVVTPMI